MSLATLVLFASLASCAATTQRGRAMPDLPGHSYVSIRELDTGGPPGGSFGADRYSLSVDCAPPAVEIRGTERPPGGESTWERWKLGEQTPCRPVAICVESAERFFVFGNHRDGGLTLRTQGTLQLEHSSRLVLEEWTLDTGEGAYHSAARTDVVALGTPLAKHTTSLLLREPYMPPGDCRCPQIERRPLELPTA